MSDYTCHEVALERFHKACEYFEDSKNNRMNHDNFKDKALEHLLSSVSLILKGGMLCPRCGVPTCNLKNTKNGMCPRCIEESGNKIKYSDSSIVITINLWFLKILIRIRK